MRRPGKLSPLEAAPPASPATLAARKRKFAPELDSRKLPRLTPAVVEVDDILASKRYTDNSSHSEPARSRDESGSSRNSDRRRSNPQNGSRYNNGSRSHDSRSHDSRSNDSRSTYDSRLNGHPNGYRRDGDDHRQGSGRSVESRGSFNLFEALSKVKGDMSRGLDDYSQPLARGLEAEKAASDFKSLLKARRGARLATLAATGLSANAVQETMAVPDVAFAHKSRRIAMSGGADHETTSIRSASSAVSGDGHYYQGPRLLCTPWAPFLCCECGDDLPGLARPKNALRWKPGRRPADGEILKYMRSLSAVERLHEEICAYCIWCEATEAEVTKRMEILARVFFVGRTLWPTCDLLPFGSFSTGLSLPLGDVDICLVDVPSSRPADAVMDLSRAIRRCRFTQNLTPITKARIPIAKFVDAHSAIHADVSINQQSSGDTSDFIRQKLKEWPQLRPLLLVLKNLLRQHDLGETYKGGIGSYMVFTMTLSYLQSVKAQDAELIKHYNLGDLLVGFFQRYVNWDYYEDAIDVRGSGRVFPKSHLSVRDADSLLCVSSPLEPLTDIGKNSYRIEDCVRRFQQRLERLKSVIEVESKRPEGRVSTRTKESSLLSAVLSIDDRMFRRRALPREHPSMWTPDYSIFTLRQRGPLPRRVLEDIFQRMQGSLDKLAGGPISLDDLIDTRPSILATRDRGRETSPNKDRAGHSRGRSVPAPPPPHIQPPPLPAASLDQTNQTADQLKGRHPVGRVPIDLDDEEGAAEEDGPPQNPKAYVSVVTEVSEIEDGEEAEVVSAPSRVVSISEDDADSDGSSLVLLNESDAKVLQHLTAVALHKLKARSLAQNTRQEDQLSPSAPLDTHAPSDSDPGKQSPSREKEVFHNLTVRDVNKPTYLTKETQEAAAATAAEDEAITTETILQNLRRMLSFAAAAAIAIYVLRGDLRSLAEMAQSRAKQYRLLRKWMPGILGLATDRADKPSPSPAVVTDLEKQLESDDVEALNGPELMVPDVQPAEGGVKAAKSQPEHTHNDYSCYQTLGEESGMMIFSGSANVELAREVCAHLSMSLGRMKVSRFTDGEISLDVLDDVRSRDVYVFQSVPNASSGVPMHAHIMELFLAVSALRRASAERITAVLPYMAYSRQEDCDPEQPRPLAVADMSRILYTLGVDRVVFVDLHAPRAAAFFPEPIPVTNLLPQSLAIRYLRKKNLRSPVVVATENTAGERAKSFWSRLKKEVDDVGLATVVSNRPDRVRGPDEVQDAITTPSSFRKVERKEHAFPPFGKQKAYFVGDVGGRDCIIVDDIIDTGVRVSNAVRACKAAGARRVLVYASHGVLSQGAVDRLDKCGAEEVLLTNTIEIPPNVYSNRLKILNISKLLAEVLRRLHQEVSGDQSHPTQLGALYRDPVYDNERLSNAHSK